MKKPAFRRNLSMGLAIVMLAASSLACLSGFAPVDYVIFPDEWAEQERQREAHEQSMRWQKQLMDSLKNNQQAAPQGEFVAPVAPVAPAAQGAAPQAAPPQAAIAGAPVILSTYFPSPVPADGQWHYGWISFTDPDGDVASLKIEIVWTTAPVKGKGAVREAEIEGPPTAGKVRMRFT